MIFLLFQLSDTKWLEKGPVKVPLALHPESVGVKFRFQAPKSAQVVGSYILGTCVKPNVHADVVLEIPKVPSTGLLLSEMRFQTLPKHPFKLPLFCLQKCVGHLFTCLALSFCGRSAYTARII